MAKKSILQEFMTDDRTRASIYEAMDEYAKQEAIGFAEFRDKYNRDISVEWRNLPDNHTDKQFNDMVTRQNLSNEKLYELYLKSKNNA